MDAFASILASFFERFFHSLWFIIRLCDNRAMSSVAEVTDEQIEEIVSFIRKSVVDSGFRGAVVGLSGGIDSAVVAKLAAMALGKNVLCVFMPVESTSKSDYSETENFSRQIGSGYELVEIQKMIDTIVSDGDGQIDIGNYAARIRMAVLFNRARKMNYLVLGTSNKSEIMIGYFTKYGDGACDVCVLSTLYKTQVRQIAKKIGIPESIIEKTPSAGFWDGQTDESDLGLSYDKLDEILSNLSLTDRELTERIGVPRKTIAEIRSRVSKSEHKRKMPAHP